MSVPLPSAAWRVVFTRDCTFDDNPVGPDLAKYDLGLNEEPLPELFLTPTVDRSRLRGPRVVSVKAVWYFTIFDITRPLEIDGVETNYDFPDSVGGQHVSNCFGRARVYTRRTEALADLAKCDLGTGNVYRVARGRTGDAKKLAALVLKGDESALPPLADALEEQSHPLAAAVRELCAPPKKRRGKKK